MNSKNALLLDLVKSWRDRVRAIPHQTDLGDCADELEAALAATEPMCWCGHTEAVHLHGACGAPHRPGIRCDAYEPEAHGLTADEIEREVVRRYKYDSARNSFRAGAVYARDFYEATQAQLDKS
jgi:hypothetical protein